MPPFSEIRTAPEAIGRTDNGPVTIENPTLEPAGLLLCLWVTGSLLFSGWLIRRNRQVNRLVRSAVPASPSLQGAMERAARQVGLKRIPELRLSAEDHSPAVCGLLRPVIVLPATLAESLNPAALRDVLLHELIHIRRGDLWIHFPQTLAQVLWWWNPLAWLANARIRVLREQAVDEEVMVRSGREHQATYPETLVAVARYCSARPLLLSLNLVGILESRRGLRARLEHLLHHPLPHRVGLGVTGWAVLAAVAVLGLPMAYSRRVEAAAAAPTTPSPVPSGEEIAIGTTVSTNVVGYVTLHTFSTTNAPSGDPGRREQTLVMPPELARRYGLTPAHPTDPANAAPQQSPGRTKIESRLRRLTLDDVAFDNSPIAEVVEFLTKATLKADPGHHGIKFLLGPDTDQSIAPPSGALAESPSNPRSLSQTRVTIKPALYSIQAMDALDAVIRVANPPLAYEIHDECVVIRPRTPSEQPLQSRVFQVDPGTLVRGIESVTGSADGTPPGVIRFPDELQSKIAEFFKAVGISVTVGQSENSQSTRGTFSYDSDSGRLTVLATPDELSTVQSALNALVVSPPEAEIQFRVVELDSSPGSTASLHLASAALDTREKVLSGIATLSDAVGIERSGTGKPLGRQLVTLQRPARSGRRVAISFAEAQLTDVAAPETEEPPVVEILPIVRSDAMDFDLNVVVRRTPTDPAPIQRRVTVKPGQSLVIVSGPFNPDSPSKPLLFSVTPTVKDPARRSP